MINILNHLLENVNIWCRGGNFRIDVETKEKRKASKTEKIHYLKLRKIIGWDQ